MKNKISIGNSGEYYVAAELERKNFTVAVPMSNVKDFDILAINRNNNNQYAIQVKTTTQNKKEWKLTDKNENLAGSNIIYVFVEMIEDFPPKYHIVPSEVVAETIKTDHQKWMNTPGKNNQQHNPNPIRIFRDKEDVYLDKWMEYFK